MKILQTGTAILATAIILCSAPVGAYAAPAGSNVRDHRTPAKVNDHRVFVRDHRAPKVPATGGGVIVR